MPAKSMYSGPIVKCGRQATLSVKYESSYQSNLLQRDESPGVGATCLVFPARRVCVLRGGRGLAEMDGQHYEFLPRDS